MVLILGTESCKWEQLEKVANDEGLGLLEGTVNNLEECHAECRRTSGCFSVRYCKEPNRADSCYLYDKEITEKDKLNQKEIANCFTSFLKCSGKHPIVIQKNCCIIFLHEIENYHLI